MRPSVVSDGDDADADDDVPGGATSLSAAFSALAAGGGGTGARRQVRLAVPVGSSALGGGGGRIGAGDDERRGWRASLSERSLFIFSEENFIRKYAKIIIEWGYPLPLLLDKTLSLSLCLSLSRPTVLSSVLLIWSVSK